MVERSDLERFRTANAELSQMVKEALEAFFSSLDLSRPEAARDALLEFIPVLVAQYGQVAATLAADWYEELTGTTGTALAESVDAALVVPQVRYAARHLWTPSPESMLGLLSVSVDKFVKQPGRDTIARNADRSGRRWRCRRVRKRARGALSWRAVTRSTCRRGQLRKRLTGPTTTVTAIAFRRQIDSWGDYPEGYDPEEYYRMYQVARDEAGSGDVKDIAAAMRRTFPDYVRDGVVAK